ncbi:MAG: Maf family protein, partial [Natronospirillum sp.]
MQILCLASASPRRQELLALLSVPFTVRPARIDETPVLHEDPDTYVQRMAVHKAEAGHQEWLAGPDTDHCWVLGADTIVVLDGLIMGKPESAADGKAMLKRLSGRTHQVLTAVCLWAPT